MRQIAIAIAVLIASPTGRAYPITVSDVNRCRRSGSYKTSALLCFMLAVAMGLMGVSAQGAVLVDPFDEGFFAFSHDQSDGVSERQVGSMIGGDRIVTLSTLRRMTTVSASVVEGSSMLVFDTGTGPLGGLAQGELILTYGGGRGSFPEHPLDLDLSGLDAFEFDIASVQGAGEVSIVLNSGGFGTSSIRVPMEVSGTLRYPFSHVNGEPLWDADQIEIHIIGLTPDFRIDLDDVRIVPEPYSVVLLSAMALFLLMKRMR